MEETKWRSLYVPLNNFLISLFDKFHIKYAFDPDDGSVYFLSSKERYDYIWNAYYDSKGVQFSY